MPRSKDQAARRRHLLEAAVQVINTQGPGRMQMKDVADVAGMAPGSVYYYYDNVDEILRHVHAMAFDRYYTARAEAVADLADAREKLRTMIDMGLPRPEDEPLSLALYQVIVAKARDPGDAEMISSLCGQQRQLYRQILDEGSAAGLFDLVLPARDIAQNLISLEDGYGIGLSAGNHDYSFEEARRLVTEAAAHWTRCPQLLDG
jgi:AcrR family transcriptional regulator